MAEWQPIETAPRENYGRLLLCGGDLSEAEIGHWSPLGGWKLMLAFTQPYVNPTHWMPIPEPPAR